MVAKIELPNLGDIIRRYQAGETVTNIARDNGVSIQTITRALQAEGVYVNRRSHQRKDIPGIDGIARRYLAGESINALSRQIGVGRFVLANRLTEAGVPLRGQSEAEAAKWERMTARQRRAQVAAAHEATRGRKATREERIKRALTVEGFPDSAISDHERVIAGLLAERGVPFTPQKAVDVFNIDIALNVCHEDITLYGPPIAVEVYGGGWHAYGSHKRRHPKRVKYLLNHGWHVVIVWVDVTKHPAGAGVADYLVSFLEHSRRLPAGRREYRVVWGDGQPAPTRNSYLNSRAVVKALGCRFDKAGSHYLVAGQDATRM